MCPFPFETLSFRRRRIAPDSLRRCSAHDRNSFTAFLISRIWLLCSRMFPSRSSASDDVKLWLPRHKCRICGVEVEFTQVRVHYQITHTEYAKWGRRWYKLIGFIVGFVLIVVYVDACSIR